MAILVTGGAGYIGSATVELLKAQGERVIVLDNLSRGHRGAVANDLTFVQGDVADSSLVERLCREHDVSACVHFAAFAYVGESVTQPGMYYRNNVLGGLGLLDGLRAAEVKHIVFSSTCATYGEPQYMPLDELHPQNPVNPYGRSKLMFERILADYDAAYSLKSVKLRYFNAAGAVEDETLAERGEDHQPEPHLIPIVLQVALGQRESVQILGTDYPTPDGTAVRDYIHILDLGDAHLKALAYLQNGGASDAFNLGNGEGYSVREVVQTCEDVSGKPIKTVDAPRREGDPSRLIADAHKALTVLNWDVKYPKLRQIVESAWAWHSQHPHGYE